MARTKKKSKAVPIVAVLTLLCIAAAVVCFLINPLVIQPQRDAVRKANEAAKAEVEARNREAELKYAAALAEDLPYAQALRLAAAASALAVQKQGAAPSIPTRAEVESFLRENE